jgi:hypothetical protein
MADADAGPKTTPIITLLTDFGTDDTYAGQMKGVIVARCPSARVIDLTHAVRPRAVEQGAFLLESALDVFPSGTITSPSSIRASAQAAGVGPARRGDSGGSLSARTTACSPVRRSGAVSTGEHTQLHPGEPVRIAVPESISVVSIEPGKAMVSAVFHGRDIFAVAAARLACGVPFARLGPPVAQILALPPFRAVARDGPRRGLLLEGRIVHTIAGNASPSMSRSSAPLGRGGGVRLSGAHHAEAGAGRLYGSSGYLVAEVNGSMRRGWPALGDPVLVEATAC